jgi:hypothetical protein
LKKQEEFERSIEKRSSENFSLKETISQMKQDFEKQKKRMTIMEDNLDNKEFQLR